MTPEGVVMELARTLERVRTDAEYPSVNMMPAFIEAVKAYATEGEIVSTLQSVFGTYIEKTVI